MGHELAKVLRQAGCGPARRLGAGTAALALLVGLLVGLSAPASGGVPIGTAEQVYSRMSENQRIGQLFMVGGAADGPGSSTRTAISQYDVGNVILTGRSTLGVSGTRSITSSLQSLATSTATAAVPLFVATDQEGGYVQVLQGSGFSRMPTGLTQGGYATSSLRADATAWGGQLHAAGVNLNLAPVLDTVPPGTDGQNPPIGYYHREYGHDTSTVASHGLAFEQGMRTAGVATAVKHFPGLGRVTANTDTSSGVTDHVTVRHDPYFVPFKDAVQDGTPFLMMSTAYYSHLDPGHPAAFSPTVIGELVRGDLGFGGVVISDDLGVAKQVAAWSPGNRALDFLGAGGDMVLTVDPGTIPAMVGAVRERVATDSSFAAKVNASALRVLRAKERRGLFTDRFVPGDFNGNGSSNVSYFRPSDGSWYARGLLHVVFGRRGDLPLRMDYDGNHFADIAIFRPSSGNWAIRGYAPIHFGRSGDIPVPADYVAHGHSDVAIFRPSSGNWDIRGVGVYAYGRRGDVPVPGDYTGDGHAEIAVFRPSSGNWAIRGVGDIAYGTSGDVPVPGDYTGDGRAQVAVFRPSSGNWAIRGQAPIHFGRSGDIPVVGDYNGDGRDDLAIFRPSSGNWDVRGQFVVHYGAMGDVPLP